MTRSIETERRGSVLVIAINRPDRLNALDRDTLIALGKVGRNVADDAGVRAVILTGRGDRAFSAGADLKERRGMSAAQVREQLLLYRRELGWIDPCPKPVVAAINGVCLGGGLEIALMCDLRIASERAVLGLPETGLGIIPGSGGTQRMPRLVGEARAKELILLARRLSAAEAERFGLVHRVVADAEDLVERAIEWVRPIAEGAPLAQAAALRAIDGARSTTMEEGLALELEQYETCLNSEDRVEALEAFAEKRAPRFKGV